MAATIENEMVVKRKWIDHQHFMDVLSTSYIIPGPNAVSSCNNTLSRKRIKPSLPGYCPRQGG